MQEQWLIKSLNVILGQGTALHTFITPHGGKL